MGAFKSLTSQDIIISPLVVYSTALASGAVLKGKNVPYGSPDDETNPSSYPSASLIYASAKQLYYSNSLPNPEATFSSSLNVRRFDNFIQSGLYAPMDFPTGYGDEITVVTIPKFLFGDYIKPGSWNIAGAVDDGEGNMRDGDINGPIVGRAIYSHGILIFTDGRDSSNINVVQTAKTIYETQYKCTIRPDEFNYSQNPTILKTSRPTNPISANGQSVDFGRVVEDFVTGSSFSPYITAVGLYDSNNICLAVGKLALPIPTSRTTDMNIIISLDR